MLGGRGYSAWLLMCWGAGQGVFSLADVLGGRGYSAWLLMCWGAGQGVFSLADVLGVFSLAVDVLGGRAGGIQLG